MADKNAAQTAEPDAEGIQRIRMAIDPTAILNQANPMASGTPSGAGCKTSP